LTGGAGADSIDGGVGDDVILARDGAIDQIVCGAGSDSVTADPFDVIAADCESIDSGDTTPPTITCPENITTTAATGQLTAVVSFAATAADNISTPLITYSHAPGSAFPAGVATVTATASDAVGNSATCSFLVTVNLSLLIDIKPGGVPNSVNPGSHGSIPVAILAVGAFDPLTLARPSLRFGPTGSEASPVRCNPEDVNGDGRVDLVCHFETLATAFEFGDTTGTISGATGPGAGVIGSDAIRIVPPQ
jgi:Ca2+-binding RTX toxin-like protein